MQDISHDDSQIGTSPDQSACELNSDSAIDAGTIHHSIRASFTPLPPSDTALTQEQIDLIFAGDRKAIRGIARFARQFDAKVQTDNPQCDYESIRAENVTQLVDDNPTPPVNSAEVTGEEGE